MDQEISKTQAMRAIDVLALGPFMIVAAKQMPQGWAKDLMWFAGVLTILYNGSNLLEARKQAQ